MTLDYAMLRIADGLATGGELDEAQKLWAAFRTLHPEDPAGYLKAVASLRLTDRVETAEKLCLEALDRCGDDERHRFATEYARLAQRREDWEEALRRWQTVDTEFSTFSPGAIGVAFCLIKLDRLDDANAQVAAARKRFPGDVHVLRISAQVAQARGDWGAATNHWSRVVIGLPDDAAAVRARNLCALQLRREEEEADMAVESAPPAPPIVPKPVRIDSRSDPRAYALLMQFENLGANPEFALVQRQFGGDPPGLLRWADIGSAALTRLLETRFAGIGEPAGVSLRRAPSGGRLLHDRFAALHPPVFAEADSEADAKSGAEDKGELLAAHASRLRFLRDELLKDLDAGKKFFVFKPEPGLPARQRTRLERAFARYPAARFLLIETATARGAPGTVEVDPSGLLRGHLSHLNPIAPGHWDIAYEEWLSVCRQAQSLGERLG